MPHRASGSPRKDVLGCIPMDTTPAALGLGAEERVHVRRALREVRIKNAIGVAWFRLVGRALLVGIYAAAWIGGWSPPMAPRSGLFVNVVALTIAIAVILLLMRPRAEWIAFAGAGSDLVLLSVGAYLAMRGGDPKYATALYLPGLQLVLLFIAFTCGHRQVVMLWVATWVVALGLVTWGGLSTIDAVVVLLIFGAFGAVLTMVGSRFVLLAARAAAEARSARDAQRHSAEMLAVNAGLRASQAEAEALSAVIVHDLRNPLTSIWANLEEVRNSLPPSNASGREAIDTAVGELRRMSDMTGDLLLVTRLENRPSIPTTTISVDGFLGDLGRAIGPLVRRAGASFEWHRMEDAPARVLADPLSIRRVLDNLLANAVRHVGKGDRVEVAAERDGDHLRLAVRNTGPPVPAEVRACLFDKHTTSGRRGWANVGLGLYMCRLVADQHRGSIALVDRPGWSVSFEVSLPAVPDPGNT